MADNIIRLEKPYKVPGNRKAFTSIRAMRRLLEQVTAEFYEGMRPARDVVAVSAGVKTMAELFVAEKQLASMGLDQEEANHPMGDDGGMPELTARGYVTVSKSYRKGTSARGTPVDEYQVRKEAGPNETRGDDLAREAENMEDEEF